LLSTSSWYIILIWKHTTSNFRIKLIYQLEYATSKHNS
jgi:hypothetical protein